MLKRATFSEVSDSSSRIQGQTHRKTIDGRLCVSQFASLYGDHRICTFALRCCDYAITWRRIPQLQQIQKAFLIASGAMLRYALLHMFTECFVLEPLQGVGRANIMLDRRNGYIFLESKFHYISRERQCVFVRGLLRTQDQLCLRAQASSARFCRKGQRSCRCYWGRAALVKEGTSLVDEIKAQCA